MPLLSAEHLVEAFGEHLDEAVLGVVAADRGDGDDAAAVEDDDGGELVGAALLEERAVGVAQHGPLQAGLARERTELLVGRVVPRLRLVRVGRDPVDAHVALAELLDEAHESDDRRARLAIEIFCYRARKYIGAYLAALNGADAVIFTGGIGENSADVRAHVCEGLRWMGVELDAGRNEAHAGGREGLISADGSRLAVYVIPTDEELLIARDTVRLIRGVTQRF